MDNNWDDLKYDFSLPDETSAHAGGSFAAKETVNSVGAAAEVIALFYNELKRNGLPLPTVEAYAQLFCEYFLATMFDSMDGQDDEGCDGCEGCMN